MTKINSTAIQWLFNGNTIIYEERQTFMRVNMNMNNDEYEYFEYENFSYNLLLFPALFLTL